MNFEHFLLYPFEEIKNTFIACSSITKIEEIYLIKYENSKFFYKEPIGFITIVDVVQNIQLNFDNIIEIINQIIQLCSKKSIQLQNLFTQLLTFNITTSQLEYPKQFKANKVFIEEQSAFSCIVQSIKNNKQQICDGEQDKQDFVNQVLSYDFKDKEKDFVGIYKNLIQNCLFVKKNQQIVLPQATIQELIHLKIKNIQQGQFYKFYSEQLHIGKDPICDNKTLDQILTFADIYKKTGNHQIAKQLFHFYKLLKLNQIEQQEKYFNMQEPLLKEVVLDEDEIDSIIKSFAKINLNQVQQQSNEWMNIRKHCVTASNFGKIFKAKDQTKIKMAYDQFNPSFFGNEATKYGNQYEQQARLQYIELNKDKSYEIQERGFIIDDKYSWIGGSPDGLVYQNGNLIGCIEIKAPFNIKDMKIQDGLEKCQFLERKNNKVQLKKSHNYYSQCQGIMYLSKVKWCDFIVFTQVDLLIERVYFEADYLEIMIQKLNEFYFKHLIVEQLIPTESLNVEMHQMNVIQLKKLIKKYCS